LELGPDTPWPLAGLDPDIADLGVIDDRRQRQGLLDTLHAHPPARLLIICDGRQTPDRGMIGLITEIVSSVAKAHILMLPGTSATEDQRAERIDQWRHQLQHAGVASPIET